MMRKSTLIRLTCLALLAVLASFGTVTLTARPAHATYCDASFTGCAFSHVQEFCSAICCIYQCPDGSQITGMCTPI